MAHPKSFCARPGCKVSRALHEVSTAACGNYIDPTSPAGVAILAAEKAMAKALALAPAFKLTLVVTPPSECACDGIEHDTDCVSDNEVTVDVPTLSDADLLAEWNAGKGAS